MTDIDLLATVPCGPEYPATAAVTITGCILIGIATVIVSAVTFVRIRRLNPSQDEDDDTPEPIEMRILKYVQPAFFVLCGVYGINCSIISVTQCYATNMDRLAANILFWFSSTMYYYHWAGFVAILCIRLQTAFKDNPVENTKYRGFNRITFAVIFIVVMGHTINAILWLSGNLSYEGLAASATLLIVLVLIYSIVLATVFVRRLFRLNGIGGSDAVVTSNMTKMTVIALVSIIGSIVMIIGSAIGAVTPMTTANYVLIAFGSMLDVLLDAMCISLSLNVHSTSYQRFCAPLDSRLENCCMRLTERNADKLERELAHLAETANEKEKDENDAGQQSVDKADSALSPSTGTLKVSKSLKRLP